ncbi:MraY family glycosyltransferase [Simiduia agarivorans]|uniref:Glycosyl transferase, group 4 family protein n=1 Tax=Simiduia agarivorans (strain DSM 21679 / JCM 13881 / BCRC 17597 / SA1) TaxID=1117647 RepID=K4KIH3_SIMAS|nr:glycosyltransferase family 4 protein [Simiduia agarivorans]AFU97763.1 glycosyl transferase, group 4 family protein [Simiduia agarivorans SA1 = DSM 21679]
MLTTLEAVTLGAATFLLSLLVTYAVKKLARLDQPNHRSSHHTPTPTGGGLGIVLAFLCTLLYIGASQYSAVYALCAAGITLLAFVSWLDDQTPLSAQTRLLVQAIAASSTLPLLYELGVNHWWWPCVVLAMMWLINLYNFMDGTDGLAAAQALVFCLGALLVLPSPSLPLQLLLIAGCAATSGFLVFNWPPARIFMGDVGSTVIGLVFGIILILIAENITTLIGGLILLAGFITDASYTLFVRFITGQRISQAHRTHYYQKMAFSKGTHYAPLLSYLIIGALVQWPLAFLAMRAESQIWILYLAGAITVHGLFCVIYKAGCPDDCANPTIRVGTGIQ